MYIPYSVTDEQSYLTDCLLLQFELAAKRKIYLYLNAKEGLQSSRTQCAQQSDVEIERCRMMFHCAINFETNYLDS